MLAAAGAGASRVAAAAAAGGAQLAGALAAGAPTMSWVAVVDRTGWGLRLGGAGTGRGDMMSGFTSHLDLLALGISTVPVSSVSSRSYLFLLVLQPGVVLKMMVFFNWALKRAFWVSEKIFCFVFWMLYFLVGFPDVITYHLQGLAMEIAA